MASTNDQDATQRRCAPLAGSRLITQKQLEEILMHEGIIPYDAIERPEYYDGGKIELAVSCATRAINELLSANTEISHERQNGEEDHAENEN